ncbi:MAG: GRP family sugar transporter [Candidatus Levybacteria bacterium]|nr:GRP family sugar transporter [Candidatus Levybacteria bacterium]MDZ4228323.1 GRP family sugar transporter [Candidatus Levybacteria bacterium]
MIWPVLAVLTAFLESLKEIFSKVGLRKNVDEYITSWSLRFFSLLLLLPLLLFIKIPHLNNSFWIALSTGGTLNIITTILYMKAIKNSDLSAIMPITAFTPLFMLITSPIILHEFPNIYGLLGIILIVFGSYILNLKERHKGFLAPFKALVRENGPRLMLIVAFIWSITSNIDKIGVRSSSPIFWVTANGIFLAITLLPIMLLKSKKSIKNIPANLKTLIPIGIFSGLGGIAQMTAINLTLVAYVVSIKRMSAIISVLFGHFFFKEKNIRERLIGAAIMIAGVLFITLS